MKKNKFVGFGDMLLRLSPEGYVRFAQADRFNINYTGAEANLAVALAYMGHPAEVVTRLPDNEIGHCAVRMLQKFGVGTEHIAYGGERIGLYYLERGVSQRPSKVIYDRKNSAFCESSYEDFDWDAVFADAAWFHFTGITPALSSAMPAICMKICETAKKHGVQVSCDLNYRKSLWTVEDAQKAMKPLMKYVDVLFTSEDVSADVLGVKAPAAEKVDGELTAAGYQQLAEDLISAYGFTKIAFTLRRSISASVNNWSAILYENKKIYSSRSYNMQIVDRVGGGDSFAAGLIYAFLHDFESQQALEFATGASCLKHSIEYDFNLSSVEEVFNLINGDGSGRIIR